MEKSKSHEQGMHERDCQAEIGYRLQEYWNSQAKWSQETFGADDVRGPEGPIKHIGKEVGECLDQIHVVNSPTALPLDRLRATAELGNEITDILILAFDAARRNGMTLEEVLRSIEQKHEINKRRNWPKPTSNTEPVEHVR